MGKIYFAAEPKAVDARGLAGYLITRRTGSLTRVASIRFGLELKPDAITHIGKFFNTMEAGVSMFANVGTHSRIL